MLSESSLCDIATLLTNCGHLLPTRNFTSPLKVTLLCITQKTITGLSLRGNHALCKFMNNADTNRLVLYSED